MTATVLCGTNIDDAIQEGIEFAKKMEVAIEITFNGAQLFICPGSDPQALRNSYERWLGYLAKI